MRGLAGSSHAFRVDFTPQWSSSVHSQLKHHHCRALHFEYEHKPVFEEGQRLSTGLLDSLCPTDGLHGAAEKQAPDDILKQLSKQNIGHSLRLQTETKKRSMRAKVPQQICADPKDNTDAKDSDLFSFDDLPMFEEDDDDEDDDDEKFLHSTSVACKHIGQILRKGNGGIPCLQAEQEFSTVERVPRKDVVDASNIGDFLSSNLLHSDLVGIPMRRNAYHQICTHTPKESEEIQSSSELVSFRSTKFEKFVYKDDAHSVKVDYRKLCMVDSEDDGSHDVVPCALHEMGNFSLQQESIVDDVSSGSLRKAFNPFHFARTYDLVALRVSLAECESLAYHLKGHLLNWPRIGNIARVEGDDMDWDSISLGAGGKKGSEEDIEDVLSQAIYGTIAPPGRMLKRVKSAEKLNPRHFRFLECISRPGRKALKEMKQERERQQNTTKRNPKKYYMVELGNNEILNSDTKLQLLGSSMKRWRGPFRLLLLDRKYLGNAELPMAVQMLLSECIGHGKKGPRREIVPCNLTLFYEYWSMEELIKHLLPSGEMSPLPIRVLGHVAVLHLGEQCSSVRYLIGKVILDKHRPKVKTVLNRLVPVEGQGHPTVEVLAGNHSLVSSIIENDMAFHVNMATMHWDSELAVERQRVVNRFSKNDIVCDVFAGAGALALPLAKKVWRVFANDPIPDALKYLARNVAESKLQAKVELYNMDCCVFLRKLLAFRRPVLMTQIIFSLPTSAETVFDSLKGAFNRETWPAYQPMPIVHVYGYSNTLHHETDFGYLIVDRLGLKAEAVELYGVKPIDSGRRLMCASFRLPETLAFDD